MIDTLPPYSPGWWLARLAKKLVANASHYTMLEDYYTGTAAIPVPATKAIRQSYQRLMSMARTNYAELVVEAVRERMSPMAFRTGADSDEGGDKEAWRIWQANQLDADSALVHRASLSMGCGYVIVGGVDDEIGAPLITPEDPREVVVECDPARRRKVVAALKLYDDDLLGRHRAYLYLPGFVFQAVGPEHQSEYESLFQGSVDQWEWAAEPQQLPVPVVPVVPFQNQADLYGVTHAEFERHLSLLDRINYTILNRLEVMTLQAFKQRAAIGVPDKDEEGNEIDYNDIFASGPDALWVMPAGSELWESGSVDLGPIRQAVRDDVQDLAAATRTPMHYLMPDSANGSAEGASLAREGLVFKTSDRIVQASESWETVMALAFAFADDEVRANRRDMEVVWASPERFSLAERYDAASKAQASGVPWRFVMSSILQFSPQEIDRMSAEKASDLFAALAAAPQVALPGQQPLEGAEVLPVDGIDPVAVKAKADALGALIRAGVDPDDAAARVGLTGIEFTGAVPVSLRLPVEDADQVESRGGRDATGKPRPFGG